MSTLPNHMIFLNKIQNEGAIKDKIYSVIWQIQAIINESVRQEREWEQISATYITEIRVHIPKALTTKQGKLTQGTHK